MLVEVGWWGRIGWWEWVVGGEWWITTYLVEGPGKAVR